MRKLFLVGKKWQEAVPSTRIFYATALSPIFVDYAGTSWKQSIRNFECYASLKSRRWIATAHGTTLQSTPTNRGCQQHGGICGSTGAPASSNRSCRRQCSGQSVVGSETRYVRNASSRSPVTINSARSARRSCRLRTGTALLSGYTEFAQCPRDHLLVDILV